MKSANIFSLLALSILLSITNVYAQTTRNVPSQYATIQAAIDSAQNSDTILVQPGTYTERINYSGKNIVLISKYGIEHDTSYISNTIIQANNLPNVVSFITNENQSAKLIGFTIQEGFYNGGNSVYNGAGILIDGASPEISNCIVKDNYISWYGGGICIKNGSTAKLNSLKIYNNHSEHHGGGIAILEAKPTLTNLLIYNNSAGERGGGIYIASSLSPEIINCTIVGNTATGYSNHWGGGISTNGIMTASVIVINSIIWNNTPNQIDDEFGQILPVYYSNVQSGYAETGNIDKDPKFVDSTSNNFRLSDNSPSIGSGVDSILYSGTWYKSPNNDFDLGTRPNPNNSNPDQGAYENPLANPLADIQVNNDTINFSVDSLISRIGDTVFVPVRASFPFGKTYSALQTKFTGYQGGLHFLGIDTTASLIGTNNWMYSVNGSDTAIVIASAGSTDISGAGVLFKIKFVVIGQSGSFTPINIAQAIFNTGTDAVTIINGGVQIWPVAFYGDVDLNGKVQAFDASVVLKYLIGADTLNYQMLSNADVMNTGVITAFDASIVLQYVVGLIPSLPYDTITMGTAQASGSFVLLDAAAPSVGDTVSMPIQFTNGKNIKSLEATLAYSPSDLDYQNVNWQNGVAGFMTAISVNKINGTVTLIGANAKSTSQSGIMANVYFKVKQQFAQSKVQFKTLRLNASAKQFNLSTANISIITGVKGLETTIPQTYVLNQNYPDPFNPSTTIQYGLPTRSNVRIVIYNMLGQQVKELVNTEQQAGYQSIVWNANVASGMYFYRIVATSLSDPNKRFVETKKMLLLK